jgi:hypothetical protein
MTYLITLINVAFLITDFTDTSTALIKTLHIMTFLITLKNVALLIVGFTDTTTFLIKTLLIYNDFPYNINK